MLSAVVLAGGTGRRLGGVDKATLVVGGSTLLDRALSAVAAADEVVVVGDPVPGVGARFTREDPPYAGPAAALRAGLAAVGDSVTEVVVLACDMPGVTAATFERLRAGAGPDGAVLVDADGRRQPALVLTSRPRGGQTALWRFLAPLDLAEVPALGGEARDVDTWADVW
jgi:molybdopterin-guanine dinucleotide biosynthesis protein A